MELAEMTPEQREAFDCWAGAMAHNARIPESQARETILGWLRNGKQTEIRDLVTLQWKPHTIRYRWHDRHWCPGYYDCLRCAG